MEALFEILKKIITNVLTAIYEPFGFALLLAFFAQFFYLYAYHPVNVGKGWKTALKTWENEFRTNCFFSEAISFGVPFSDDSVPDTLEPESLALSIIGCYGRLGHMESFVGWN